MIWLTQNTNFTDAEANNVGMSIEEDGKMDKFYSLDLIEKINVLKLDP
jgi:hypothetical protein